MLTLITYIISLVTAVIAASVIYLALIKVELI
jgi:hypothetical protein